MSEKVAKHDIFWLFGGVRQGVEGVKQFFQKKMPLGRCSGGYFASCNKVAWPYTIAFKHCQLVKFWQHALPCKKSGSLLVFL